MLRWLQERITELREGLEELQAQAQARSQSQSQSQSQSEFEHDGDAPPRGPGLRRQAPVSISADDDPWEPPAQSTLESLDLVSGGDSGRPKRAGVAAPRAMAIHPGRIRDRLREPGRIREAIVLREILDRPLALRHPVRRSFRDR